MPRWLTKALVVVIVSALITAFLLVLLIIVGQFLQPGLVGLRAALSVAGGVFVVSLGLVARRVLLSRDLHGPAREPAPSGPDTQSPGDRP